jgi:hypothetical protein
MRACSTAARWVGTTAGPRAVCSAGSTGGCSGDHSAERRVSTRAAKTVCCWAAQRVVAWVDSKAEKTAVWMAVPKAGLRE